MPKKNTAAVVERSILMSGPMVRATRGGKKTKTRRSLKLQPTRYQRPNETWNFFTFSKPYTATSGRATFFYGPGNVNRFECPYGKPGDRLTVGEAWRTLQKYDHLKPSELPADAPIWYEADDQAPQLETIRVSAEKPTPSFDEPASFGRYRHARFLPRRFRRLILVITSVRVERLHDISEADAQAEGVLQNPNGSWHDYLEPDRLWQDDAVASFISLWLSINGKESWDANPWVWVIGFRLLD